MPGVPIEVKKLNFNYFPKNFRLGDEDHTLDGKARTAYTIEGSNPPVLVFEYDNCSCGAPHVIENVPRENKWNLFTL